LSNVTVTDFLAAKLRPPWGRAGLVARTSLLDRLLSAEAQVIAVVAPPGYGKTTLLSQLKQRSPQRPLWVSLDELDNDPAVLFSYLVAAFDQIEPRGSGASGRSSMPPDSGDLGPFLRRLAVVVASVQRPFCLIVDHVEAIESRSCADAIAELAFNLPLGSRLVLASRRDLPIPISRLRARGSVLDVGIEDLAMSEREARELLMAAGVELADEHLDELMTRTEGWPAGLYLASLAIRAGGPRAHAGFAFRGGDRFIADYLKSEVMTSLSPDTATFLTRTSILDRLCGPLCDAVAEMHGSQKVLASLAGSNLLIVPLDRRGCWYRCHHLLRELLQTELSQAEPEIIPRLHDEAAAWFEANGYVELAIGHAQAAGDSDRAARLVASIGHQMFTAGRIGTLLGWLEWFDARGLVDRYPHLAVLGALAESVEGHPKNAERWAQRATSDDVGGVLEDGSTIEGWIAVIDAYMCRNGVAQMRADAELALAQLAPGSPWCSGAVFFEAMSHLLEGDVDTADRRLADAVDISLQARAMPMAARAMAERAVVAIERHDWDEADAHARDALAVVEAERIETFLDSIVALAVAARSAAHHGRLEEARRLLTLASRLRPKCTAFFPLSAQFLVQLAHAYLGVADPGGAQAVVHQIRSILASNPDVGLVGKQADELQQMVDAIRVGPFGASTLTAAELRLLPLLTTHLTMKEIGQRLFVSTNTVKTQAISTYRKLGVSTRSEAIQRAEEIGLLSR
jgi:LuxR family transcriptional regulator, maltose regulon positive regulatory protein